MLSTAFWGSRNCITSIYLRGVTQGTNLRQYSGLPLKKTKFSYPEGVIPSEEDYSEYPEYPEIDPETHQWNEQRRLRRQNILDWHHKIREQPNVEAKHIEINKPKKYGWSTKMLTEGFFDYNTDDCYKFLTRTHLMPQDQLPEIYSSAELSEKSKYFVDKVKGPLLEALRFELNEQDRSYEHDLSESAATIDFKKSQSIINQVNRIILSILGNEIDHLRECQVDYTPKIEAFWFVGGQQPTGKERAQRKGNINRKTEWNKAKIKEDDPVERAIQYIGSPLLQLRCKNSIQNLVDQNDASCRKSEEMFNIFPHDLTHFGLRTEFRYGSLIPGTWTGDSSKCSHIAFHARHHLLADARKDNKYWTADNENAIASQAILASFGRLLAQAMYHGFDQFSNLNYPFSSQTVITDGLNWSFFAYQLNTTQLGEMFMKKNFKQNVCWGTKSMNIFDEENKDSLNIKTLELLLMFYLNTPIPNLVDNPTPYLKTALTDFDDEIQREIIFYNYRDMVSQRWTSTDCLRNRQYPEIYEWERIYKIRHPQRHMEARRRFFELPNGFQGYKPYNEPYPLLYPRHIRRGLRVLKEAVAARKEEERIEAAKKAESAKYVEHDES